MALVKKCTKCGQVKSVDDFGGHRQGLYGKRPDCKECRSAQLKARRAKLGSTEFTARKHGINANLYNEILEIQRGVCFICERPPQEGERPLAIDHDHETGRLRGLLCARCNGALGMLRDDPDLARRAADYLDFWRKGWVIAGAWVEEREAEQAARMPEQVGWIE